VLRHPAVTTVVVGARDREQLSQNVTRCQTALADAVWPDLIAADLIQEIPQ